MKKVIGALLILSSFTVSAGQQVFVTEHGKAYHLYENCRSLTRSKVLTIDIKDIKDRALCLICKHRKGDNK